MKLFLKTSGLVTLSVLVLLCSSCKVKNSPTKPGSGGKTCEILLVCDRNWYENGIENQVKDYFMSVQMGLNALEPKFTVAHVEPSAFENSPMFQKHRNLIIVKKTESDQAEPGFSINQERWSTPQIVFYFDVPTVAAFEKLFEEKKEMMQNSIYHKEYTRMERVFKKSENTGLSDRLRTKFGFSLVFPEGYGIANETEDFIWIRKESKDYGQGIFIHVFPYKEASVLEMENILKKRNQIAALIPGPADGSYMTTEQRFPEYAPFCRPINLASNYAIETRGLWRLEGDFMGGPFVNYTLVNEKRKEVIMMDAYLYSPRKPQRDLLMQLEGIARSFEYYLPKQKGMDQQQ